MRDVNVDTDLKQEDTPLPHDAAPPVEADDLGARLRALITEDLMARMKQSGFDEVGGIGHLIEMERYAASDPAGYLKLVARHAAGHGVDIGAALREAVHAGGADADPRAAVMRRIEAFRDATDEAGAPRHPHYEAVSGEMAQLIRADPSLDLAQAYGHAVWMNPQVRETLIEAELANRQAKLHADDTDKARRAASDAALAARQNIRPGGGGFARTPDVRNLDDAIAIALRQVNA